MKFTLALIALSLSLIAQAATFRSLSKMSNATLERLVDDVQSTFEGLPIESPETTEVMIDRKSFQLTNSSEARAQTLKQLAHRLVAAAHDRVEDVAVKRMTLASLSKWENIENTIFGVASFVDNPETQMSYLSSILVDALKTQRVEIYSLEVTAAHGEFSALAIVDTQRNQILLLGTQETL
jgi:hypothetical protein